MFTVNQAPVLRKSPHHKCYGCCPHINTLHLLERTHPCPDQSGNQAQIEDDWQKAQTELFAAFISNPKIIDLRRELQAVTGDCIKAEAVEEACRKWERLEHEFLVGNESECDYFRGGGDAASRG